jgi:hypothetical protein
MPMLRLSFMWAVIAFFGLCGVASSQVENLEGEWNIETSTENAEFSLITIDNKGNAAFTEHYTYKYMGDDYLFNVNHTGKFLFQDEFQAVYAGLGMGESTNTGNTVVLQMESGGTGLVSTDFNQIVGVWVNKETYQTAEGQLDDEDSASYVMTRVGYEPGTPGELVAGIWKITITGQNIDWTGTIELDPDGTLAGEYAPEGVPETAWVLAGLYRYSEQQEFNFTYTTEPVELPLVGETTFFLSGTGQGNDDHTQIEGTWSITVKVSNLVTRTFEGTFLMVRLDETLVTDWFLF